MYLFSSLVASLVFVVFLMNWVWKQITKKYKKFHVKELRTIPFLGDTLSLERKPEEFFKQMQRIALESNHVGVLWIGTRPVVATARQDHAETLLRDMKLLSKSFLYQFLHPWLKTGLLTSTGDKWRSRRKLLTPPFHFGILKGFAEVFKNESDVLVEKVKTFAESGDSCDISHLVTLCTLDVICETSMGVKIGAQDGKHKEYINAVLSMSKVIQRRQRSPWLWSDIVFKATPTGKKHDECLKILHGFTDKVIRERIESRKNKIVEEEVNRKRLAFLDLILSSYEEEDIDFAGIQEEVDTFMFEGHDTTSHGISWTMYLLGRHPEIQKKVQEEVDAYFVDDWEELVDATRAMKLLERVIKESLRMYPPVPFIGRKVTEEDHSFGDGLDICKGHDIVLFVHGLHHNPDIWPEPSKFDPDRFLPENCTKRHPYAYVPFSAGPRNCIGQKFAMLEEKIVLATFLKHYDIHSLAAEEDLSVCAELITRANKGLWVQLKKRNLIH